LNVKSLYKFIFIIICLFTTNITKAQCLQANIVLLIDWSGSEAGNEAYLAHSALLFMEKLPIKEHAVQLSIITFSNDGTLVVPITYDKERLTNSILSLVLTRANGGTNIGGATKLALDELTANERGVRNLIIIISDGEIDDYALAMEYIKTAEKIITLNIFAVQIGGDEEGAYILLQLTGDVKNIVASTSRDLVEALLRLDLCN